MDFAGFPMFETSVDGAGRNCSISNKIRTLFAVRKVVVVVEAVVLRPEQDVQKFEIGESLLLMMAAPFTVRIKLFAVANLTHLVQVVVVVLDDGIDDFASVDVKVDVVAVADLSIFAVEVAVIDLEVEVEVAVVDVDIAVVDAKIVDFVLVEVAAAVDVVTGYFFILFERLMPLSVCFPSRLVNV